MKLLCASFQKFFRHAGLGVKLVFPARLQNLVRLQSALGCNDNLTSAEKDSWMSILGDVQDMVNPSALPASTSSSAVKHVYQVLRPGFYMTRDRSPIGLDEILGLTVITNTSALVKHQLMLVLLLSPLSLQISLLSCSTALSAVATSSS